MTTESHLKQRRKNKRNKKRFHEETFIKVAAYISLMMTRWEDMDVIYAPFPMQ